MVKETDFDDIYKRLQEKIKVEDITEKKITDWLTTKPSQKQKVLISDLNEMNIDKGKDLIREVSFSEARKLNFADKTLQEQKDNVVFNDAMTTFRGLRDSNDVEGLISFKYEVKGIKYDDEVIEDIDIILERIKAKGE